MFEALYDFACKSFDSILKGSAYPLFFVITLFTGTRLFPGFFDNLLNQIPQEIIRYYFPSIAGLLYVACALIAAVTLLLFVIRILSITSSFAKQCFRWSPLLESSASYLEICYLSFWCFSLFWSALAPGEFSACIEFLFFQNILPCGLLFISGEIFFILSVFAFLKINILA